MLKKLTYALLLGLAAGLLASALWLHGALDSWEFVAWKYRAKYFADRSPVSQKVKIILIDQASLDWGKNENGWSWPWPREVYGPILDYLRRNGAKAVAFDMLYTEPSVNGVADDEAFGEAIRRSVPFVGTVVLGKEAGTTTNWPAEIAPPQLRIGNVDRWLSEVNRGRLNAPSAVFPIPELATNVTMLANVMDLPDRDGVFRRATFFRAFDGRAIPSLGFAAYLASRPEGTRVSIEKGWLTVDGRRIPIDGDGRAILRFQGHNGLHESYSAASVIQSELRLQAGEEPTIRGKDVFKDCIVFLGPSAPGLMDLKPTPLSKVCPGVEVHATVLDNLLETMFLRDAPAAHVVPALFVLAIVSGLLVILSRRAWQSVAAFAVLLPVPVALGYAAYAAGSWWPVVASELAVAFALVGAVVVNYATEGRQKTFIKNAFKFYVGPEVIDQMIADPKRLKLGGEKRELSIFFSDIEKFSSFSEKLKPETLIALLNDYLSDMGAIIKEEGGYLDKFIGDAIVAFWNAPLPQPDHAVRICRAALRCQRKLAERRAEIEQTYGAKVKCRIGINTGDVILGNMGSRERFNYTVLGDAANLASRLEGANKAFGTYIMVSESTWAAARGEFIGRELGRIRVVGRQTPVAVYEPVGFKGETPPAFFGGYEQALAKVRAGQWAEALAPFEACGDDPVAKAYVAECKKLLSEPSAKWDGIWNLTEK